MGIVYAPAGATVVTKLRVLFENAADTFGLLFHILAAITPAEQLIALAGITNGVSRVVEYELPSAETPSAPTRGSDEKSKEISLWIRMAAMLSLCRRPRNRI